MLDGGLTNTINTVVRLVFLFWQGLRQDVQAKQQALHRLQQAQEVRRMQSAAQKDIVQHKEEEQVLRVAVQRGKEEQEAAVVREVFVIHVGGTRCVTSSTANNKDILGSL